MTGYKDELSWLELGLQFVMTLVREVQQPDSLFPYTSQWRVLTFHTCRTHVHDWHVDTCSSLL